MHPLGGTAGPNASVSPAPAAAERECSDTLLDDAVKRQGFQGEPPEAFGMGLHGMGRLRGTSRGHHRALVGCMEATEVEKELP